MNFTDFLLAKLGLPSPGHQLCVAFYYQQWKANYISANPALGVHALYDRVLDLLRAKKIFPDQIKEHGPGFDYPLYFVCAALLEGFTCMEDIEEIVSRMANCKYIFESPWSAAFAETYSSTG
jgi:hypothetical protein